MKPFKDPYLVTRMSNIPTPFSTNHLALCLLLMMTTFIEREREKKPCHRHPRRVRRPSVLLDGSSSSSKLTFKFLVLSSFFKRPVYQGRWSRSRSSSSSSSIRIIEVHNYFSFFSLFLLSPQASLLFEELYCLCKLCVEQEKWIRLCFQ